MAGTTEPRGRIGRRLATVAAALAALAAGAGSAAAATPPAGCYLVTDGIARSNVPRGTYVPAELGQLLITATDHRPVLCRRPATVPFDIAASEVGGRAIATGIAWTAWGPRRARGLASWSLCSTGCDYRKPLALSGPVVFRSRKGVVRVFSTATARVLPDAVLFPRPTGALDRGGRLRPLDRTRLLAAATAALAPATGVAILKARQSYYRPGWIAARVASSTGTHVIAARRTPAAVTVADVDGTCPWPSDAWDIVVGHGWC